MYIQYLANANMAPLSIKNYLSGARSWINHHKGSDISFASHEASSVLKTNLNASKHVPRQAPPLTPHHVKLISFFLDSLPSTLPAIKAAFLIGYTCFLQSSNLLSPTITQWGGSHTLRVSDISLSPSGLTVRINSSKTLKNSPPVFLAVPYVQDPSTCPVRAWTHYVQLVNPHPSGPAFMLDSLTPLTPKPLVDFIRLALQHASVPNFSSFSLHSLRRGAARAAHAASGSLNDIKVHGTWATDSGLPAYVPSSSCKVSSFLASSLAN